MNKDKLVTYSFIISFIATIIGALMKIMHVENANILLTIGLLALAIFAIVSIYEVTSSEKIKVSEKIMWIVGFIFLGNITGLLYILSARKRIV